MISGLYERFHDEVERYARSISRDSSEADDLVQETFIRAMGNLPLLGTLTDRQQRAWFFRVIKNCRTDIRRKEAREIVSDDLPDIPVDTGTLQKMEILDCFGSLPPEQQDVLFKSYYLGMSSREISVESGIPSATARFRLHAAIKKIRKQTITCPGDRAVSPSEKEGL